MMLCTTEASALQELADQCVKQEPWAAMANTVICLGWIGQPPRRTRALMVVKHRGSTCRQDAIPFQIQHEGLVPAPHRAPG